MQSPLGEDFRHWMDIWDAQVLREQVDDKKEKIQKMIDNSPMILFLKNKNTGDIFGADEPARVTFAHMKEPGEGLGDKVQFPATNLCKALQGENEDRAFGSADLKDLDVVQDTNELIAMLLQKIGKGKISIRVQKDDEES